MFKRARIATVVFALVAPLFVTAVASSATGPTASCAGDYAATWPGVTFGNLGATIVAGNSYLPRSRTITLTTAVPAGEYSVQVVSYDGSDGRATDPVQDNEQYRLEFLDGAGLIIDQTGNTADLTDGVEEATWSGGVGNITLDRPAVQVRAQHAFSSNAVVRTGVHSLMPSCFAATDLAPPTTTTAAPTTTTAAPTTTTAAPTTTTAAPVTTTAAPVTTTVVTQVLPEVQVADPADPVNAVPSFTG